MNSANNINSPYSQKLQIFKKEIRRQKIFQQFKLYRNDVFLSDNKEENIKLFHQNVAILQQSKSEQEISNALKIIRKLFEKYDFSKIQNIKMTELFQLITLQENCSDFILENCMTIIQLTSQREIALITFQLINYDLLKSQRYEIIAKILEILYQILVKAKSYQQFLNYVINQKKIVEKIVQLMVEQKTNKLLIEACPNFRKSLKKFIAAFIYYSQQQKIQEIINKSYKYAEKDFKLIKQHFFNSICQQIMNEDKKMTHLFQDLTSLQYLRLFVKIGVKIDFNIIQHLQSQLINFFNHYQNNLQRGRALCEFFNTLVFHSDFALSENAVQRLLRFLFEWENCQFWTKKQQNQEDEKILQIVLAILSNHIQNTQTVPEDFFSIISCSTSQQYPKTLNFVSVLEFCVDRQLQIAVKLLISIIGTIVVITGQLGVFSQCVSQIIQQKQGLKKLQELGFQLTQQDNNKEDLYQCLYEQQCKRLEESFDLQFKSVS